MKKKILVLNPVGFVGGAEISLVKVLKNLDGLSFNVIVPFRGRFTDLLKKNDIPFDVINSPAKFDSLSRNRVSLKDLFLFFKFANKIKKQIKDDNYSFIYTNGVKMHIIGIILSLLTGIPIIWHFRDIIQNQKVKKTVYLLSLFTKKIICNSEYTRSQFPIFKTVKIYNPIDLYFSGEIISTPNKRRLGIVSHITPIKNIKLAIEALSILEKDYTLHIFGEEPYLTHSSHKDELLKTVKELGLEERVYFHGFISDPEKIYNGCELILSLSSVESFGRTPLEALSYNKPIIATNTGVFYKMDRFPFVISLNELSKQNLSRKINTIFNKYEDYNKNCNRFWVKNRKSFDIMEIRKKIKKVFL